MRLKQAMQNTEADNQATEPVYTPHAVADRMEFAAPLSTLTAPAQSVETVSLQTHVTTDAFPEAGDIYKTALLGVVYGLLSFCLFTLVRQVLGGMFAGVPFTAKDASTTALVSMVTQLTLLFLQPMVTAFWLGWRAQNGMRGVVLGFTLALTLFAVLLGCAAVFPWPLTIPMDVSRLSIAVVLATGALGGACRRVREEISLRSRKANR